MCLLFVGSVSLQMIQTVYVALVSFEYKIFKGVIIVIRGNCKSYMEGSVLDRIKYVFFSHFTIKEKNILSIYLILDLSLILKIV